MKVKLTIEEKLEKKGYKFNRVQLIKYKDKMGVICPYLYDTFVLKEYCKACPRWLGGSGKYYYCEIE